MGGVALGGGAGGAISDSDTDRQVGNKSTAQSRKFTCTYDIARTEICLCDHLDSMSVQTGDINLFNYYYYEMVR